MKKLYIFIPLIAIISVLFWGCEKNQDVTSANENVNKKISLTWGDPQPITGDYVDLVAGQHNPVGKVYITKETDGDITIRYTLNSEDCKITEVHVDIAKDLGIYSDDLKGGFHVNSQGNPQHGLFDKTEDFGDGTFDDVTITFSAAEMEEWLGVSSYSGKLYIAIHAGVCCPSGTTNGEANYCLDLSDYVYFSTNGSHEVPSYHFNPVKVYDANQNYLTEFPAWCVNYHREFVRDSIIEARFISTACDTLPDDLACIIGHPENLDRLNYLLNNFQPEQSYTNIGYVGNEEYQLVIWKLMDGDYPPNNNADLAVVNALYNECIYKWRGL